MSTEKIEINPDSTNESLEQSAEKVSKDGVDVSKDVNISTDGTTATVTPKEVQEEKPISESVRPNWLPEKFANAEELAKAYGEDKLDELLDNYSDCFEEEEK